MKQIMEYFGGAVIAVLIAPVVLGVFAKLPAVLETSVQDKIIGQGVLQEDLLGSNQAFAQYQQDAKWVIQTKTGYLICAGVRYRVENVLQVLDPIGAECRVRFCGGFQEGTAEPNMEVMDAGLAFWCASPGVYQVHLECESQEYGIYETTIRLVVNGEEAL